jgi:hypothetical protein
LLFDGYFECDPPAFGMAFNPPLLSAAMQARKAIHIQPVNHPTQEAHMKTLMIVASLFALATPAMAVDVGVSINIGQPNFYGRIDIDNFPQPRVIYQQPIIVERPRHDIGQRPIYLRVPPGHQKNWSKHCRRYDACGQRVYFVQDSWYQNDYAPRFRERHGDRHERGNDNRYDGRGDDRHEQRGRGKHEDKYEDKYEDKHNKHGDRGRGKRD